MRAAPSALALALCAAAAAFSPPRPHIFFVVADDLGWSDVGYHRNESHSATPEVRTPTIDALVADGVEMGRHYVHMICTPSRASLQTGRLPAHVITTLADPCDANGAIPRNMTGLAAKLKQAGYATHHVGKWDAGMATPTHTPRGRGYDSSLNYFGHGNWAWSEGEWGGSTDHQQAMPTPGFADLWDTDGPARSLRGTGHEEYLFRARMLRILREHDQATPLFMLYASKLAHYPLQVPYSLTHSLTHPPTHPPTHSLTHSLTHSPHSLTHSQFRARSRWEIAPAFSPCWQTVFQS